jgi:DNA repair protein RecN (Recombination protein N)
MRSTPSWHGGGSGPLHGWRADSCGGSIATNGPGRVHINDAPASRCNCCARVGDVLVDMHGPHEHQSLLHHGLSSAISSMPSVSMPPSGLPTGTPYQTLLALEAERESYANADGDTATQIDLLDYQIRELEQADLENTDEEELLAEHTRIANAARIIELADSVSNALTGEEHAAISAIVTARRALTELAGLIPEAEEWLENLENITVQTKEISQCVASLLHKLDVDPERLTWVEDRMSLLQKLKRKYGRSVADMRDFLTKASERRQNLSSRETRLEEIAQAAEAANKLLQEQGTRLRKARIKHAADLATLVAQHLHDLGFQHARFTIDVQPTSTPAPDGIDIVDFGFAPNPGEEMRPLKAIASSGEISRVMLALKAVLARHDKVPVLVFDEIDANLGGEMGNAVGRKLATVAEAHQVLCITHLPQVAVYGQHHLVVSKTITNGRTHVHVQPVEAEARAEEIARMLGGKNLTSVTLRHARELLHHPAAG